MINETTLSAEDQVTTRVPAAALLLSICPGLGPMYAGNMVKGIILYVSLIVVSWLAAIAFMFVDSRVGMIFLAVPFIGMTLIAADAYRSAKKQDADYRLQWFNKGWIYTAVFLGLLVTVNPVMDVLVGQQIVRAYLMSSEGMEPTILKRDIVLINKLAFPEKGEIAFIELDNTGTSSQLSRIMDNQIIARIVAVPGDTIEVRGHDVLVNDVKPEFSGMNSAEGAGSMSIGGGLEDFPAQQVPADRYFVLADNRNYGIDSRVLGYIEKDKIAGKISKVFWSWNLDEGRFLWSRTAMNLK